MTSVHWESSREVTSPMLRSITPKRAKFWSFQRLIESLEGPRKHPPNSRKPHATAGPAEDIARRTARGPPERLMRPDGTIVLARRTVLPSSSPRVRLAAIPPVRVASMPRGGWADVLCRACRLSWS